MKHLLKTATVAVAIATGTLTGAAPVAADTLNVTVVAGHPPIFRWVKHLTTTFIPSVNAALEGTGTSVNWSEQYGGSLAGVGEELEAVEEGLAEVGAVSSLFDSAKLSVQNITYFTPFASSDIEVISSLMDNFQKTNDDMIAAWTANNLVYLGGGTVIDDYLLMTNFPVNSMADLKGKKIGAPGPAVNWLKGTGAVGVSGNLTTYYNEIQTGVYDGVIVFASAAVPGKLYEVAPYVTRVGFGAQYAGGVAANLDWFNAQSPAVQDAFRNAGDDYRDAYNADLMATVNKFLGIMEAKGATITTPDQAFREQWAAGLDNVAKLWAESLDAKGLGGSAVLSAYMTALRDAGATPVRNWDLE